MRSPRPSCRLGSCRLDLTCFVASPSRRRRCRCRRLARRRRRPLFESSARFQRRRRRRRLCSGAGQRGRCRKARRRAAAGSEPPSDPGPPPPLRRHRAAILRQVKSRDFTISPRAISRFHQGIAMSRRSTGRQEERLFRPRYNYKPQPPGGAGDSPCANMRARPVCSFRIA